MDDGRTTESSRSSSRKVLQPSKVVSSPFENVKGAKETEIEAHITLPIDGGWGWVVLSTALYSVTIVDGLVFTYGALLHDISDDFEIAVPAVALVGSLNYTLYLMFAPIASALINKFGFRFCAMFGGMICSFSALTSTFSKTFTEFLILYGIFCGIGYSFSSMSAYLVVGFYFRKYRTVAMNIVASGSSIGMMVLSPMNLILVHLAGWRPTVLLHSGLLASLFFMALAYRPLVSLTVATTEDAAAPSRFVTFLPNEKKSPEGTKPTANPTERVLGTISNTRYPTAAEVVEKSAESRSLSPGTSAGAPKHLTLTSTRNLSKSELKEVKAIIPKGSVDKLSAIEIKIEEEGGSDDGKKKSCWGRLCYWRTNAANERPLYRDDAFYDGKMHHLPQYRKSKQVGHRGSGIEYLMSVSRAATIHDLREERHSLCPAAVKRVLATMFDVGLFKTCSFRILCCAGVCNYLGLLTPLTYLTRRNLEAGISIAHCRTFVATIGFFNVLGRVVFSILAIKISPSYLYGGGLLVSGLSTILSGLSNSLFYQYVYCALFGMTICVSNAMRSIMVCELYGLERLTNGVGMLLFCMGVGNLFSTPIAGILRQHFGYDPAFYFAGFFLALGGILALPIKKIRNREIKREMLKHLNIGQTGESTKPTVIAETHQDKPKEPNPNAFRRRDSLKVTDTINQDKQKIFSKQGDDDNDDL